MILSIEDNCSLPQQRKMATAMQEVFGDMLVVHPMERNEKHLPSPHQLRRRIILKHKKLPEGEDEASFLVKNVDGKQSLLVYCALRIIHARITYICNKEINIFNEKRNKKRISLT